jgi:hypothetical protein
LGLTREALRDGPDRRRHARETGEDAREPDLAVGLFLGRRDFAAMTNLAKDYRALLANAS